MRRLIAASLVVLLFGACSNSDDDKPSASTDDTTTTTVARPPDAAPQRTTAFEAKSSGALPQQGEDLKDGEYFGYIRAATTTSIDFDVAQFFFGADAQKYWDEHDTPEDERNNDTVILNNTKATRDLAVVDGTTVTVVRGDPTAVQSITMARFVEQYDKGEDPFIGADAPYWIKVVDGYVVAVDGQFFP